jgi:hypothetical protein
MERNMLRMVFYRLGQIEWALTWGRSQNPVSETFLNKKNRTTYNGQKDSNCINILSRFMCDCRRGSDWWLGLLTIYEYTHHTELQVITALSIISTIHKSPQHPLNPFPACCVFISRSLVAALTVKVLQLPPLRSYLHSLPCRILCQLTVNWSIVPSFLSLPCRTQLSVDYYQAGGHFTPNS